MQNEPFQQTPTPVPEPPQSTLPTIIGVALSAFLVGVVITAAGFTLFNHFTKSDDKKKTADSLTQKTSETEVKKNGVVSEDELKKYTNSAAKDCAENPKYSNLELVATKYVMKSVDFDAQKITMTRTLYDGRSEDFSIVWKILPATVDGNCNEITFADIKTGDNLNLYVAQDDRYLDSGTKLIQRTSN